VNPILVAMAIVIDIPSFYLIFRIFFRDFDDMVESYNSLLSFEAHQIFRFDGHQGLGGSLVGAIGAICFPVIIVALIWIQMDFIHSLQPPV